MPAAAVIPAPVAYIKVVAVKKLVVGCRKGPPWCPSLLVSVRDPECLPFLFSTGIGYVFVHLLARCTYTSFGEWNGFGHVTVKKSECSKQAFVRMD